MRERHGHALRRRKPVFAIENHAVAAIEKNYRSARTVVLALVNHQVRVSHLDRNFGAFEADRIEERGANVHVERVPEFVRTRDAAGLDAGGEVASIVAPEAAAAQRAEQVLQGFESQKIDRLVGNFEARFGPAFLRLAELPARGCLRRWRDLWRPLRIDETFIGQPLRDFVEEIFDLLT